MTPDELVAQLGPLRLPRKFIPAEPTLKQEVYLRSQALECFFGGAAGPGKAESVENSVPTTTGWKRIADIEAGDNVFDADGQPRVVLAVGPVQFGRPCMEVVFSDGTRIVCDEQHEWVTIDYKARARSRKRCDEYRANRRETRESKASGRKSERFTESLTARNRAREYDLLEPEQPVVRETRELAETLSHRGRVNHAIPITAPLALPEAVLPIDPYTLGVWLGDGSKNSGLITNDPRDDEIIGHIPYPTRRSASTPIRVRIEGLTRLLRLAGVYNDKHIPIGYLRASFEQRLALLQGIVDTDGHVDGRDGRIEITLVRWALIEGVCELVASLGIRFTVTESRATLDGRDIGPRWRIAFQTGHQAARLSRKRDAQNRGPFRRWSDHRYIVDVRRIPSVPVRCIEVEGGIYLTGRTMIPTHNSWGLLMAAAQYVDLPDYHAVILRPALTEFTKPGGLIPLSHDWWAGKAGWNGSDRRWTFPSRATVSFGYLGNLGDLKQYKGPSYMFVGFDELTSFSEALYRGMFRVLRRPVGHLESVPVRLRSASNPGDVGHSFVKSHFVDPKTREANVEYVRATLADNPFLDYEEYVQTLSHMSPVDRDRLIRGDWDVMEEGGKFRRNNFRIIEPEDVTPSVAAVRYWDLAGTEPSPSNSDPDWTVGLRLDSDRAGNFTVRDLVALRADDSEVEATVRLTAELDGRAVPITIEQDPGQAGKAQISHYARNVLQGFAVTGGHTKISGKNAAKEVRARPVAAAVANGLVRVVRGPNAGAFLDCVSMFPQDGHHDDYVDALSGAYNRLTRSGLASSPRGMRVSRPVGHIADRSAAF